MIDLDVTDSELGNWFAGFADGEGSFCVARTHRTYQCMFVIHLRVDDGPVLDMVQDWLGIGTVRRYHNQQRRRLGENPQARWFVGSKAECAFLVQVFERFPLRAKKRQDFLIWKEAVAEWNRISPGQGRNGRAVDWSRLEALRCQLNEGRRYLSDDTRYDLPEPAPQPAVAARLWGS